MIRRLRLTSWRAYEDLSLDLGPGTTFVVAPNGIGKTSLIEAAAWALYGVVAGRPPEVVRKGAKKATASVDLELHDGRVLTLSRDMPVKLARGAAVPVDAHLDGAPIPSDEAESLLADSLAGELPFLARLTILRTLSSGLADPEALDLNRNLSRVFGIDGLETALGAIEHRRKSVAAEIKLARQVARPTTVAIATLNTAATDARLVAERAGESHDVALRSERDAENALVRIDQYDKWVTEQDHRRHQLTDIAREAAVASAVLADMQRAHESDEQDLATSLQALWRLDESRLAAATEQANVRIGVLRSRIETLRTSLSELDTAEGECPVCRRPLSVDDEQAARAQHENDLVDLERELSAAIEDDSVSTELRRTREHLAKVSHLLHKPDRPATPPGDRQAGQEVLDKARATRMNALELLVAARKSADSAKEEYEQATADAAEDQQLINLYRQEAALLAAAESAQRAADTLMAQTVSPLADELRQRWKLMFADRGDVTLKSGAISREVNGEDLTYNAFSEGEKAFAQVLLRLLILDAATRANFCWIDEPLEHLDPQTRRHVANMLARAVGSSNARQLVVTTYEEPLARRLALRYPDQVQVIYVRPGSPASAI